MSRYALTLKPVLAAIVLGACSTTPDMPKNAWKITPVQTVRHGGATADGYFALGRVKEGQGASTQAIEAYRKAISAAPAHAAAWNALGALQMQLGRTDEGLQALERAVSLSPTTSHLQNNLGYALLLAGRDEAAANSLRRAVELDASNRRAWSNLATAYRRQGALDQAEFAEARASGKWPTTAATAAKPAMTAPAPLPSPATPVSQSAQLSDVTAPALITAPTPHAPAPTITASTVSVQPPPVTMPIAALQPQSSSTTDAPPAEKPTTTSLETSTASLGFMPVTPAIAKAAVAPVVTTTPRATLVKVAENVFELRNGPAPHDSAVAEATAIIAAVAPAAPVLATPLRAVAASTVTATPAAAIAAKATTARYEITNGQGGEGLARRLAALLGREGFERPRLTNHKPFDQVLSYVEYREGYREAATAFAKRLPFRAELRAVSGNVIVTDVRLMLGKDLNMSDACSVLGLCSRYAHNATPTPQARTGGFTRASDEARQAQRKTFDPI